MTISSPLAVSKSSIKVMNAALAEIGVPAITSFLDTSLAARTGNALYADILEGALASYPWRFARKTVTLQQVEGDAPAGYARLYRLPGGALNVHVVYEGDSKTIFDVFGRDVAIRSIWAGYEPITAQITEMVPPDRWAGYFRRAFTLQLAAALAMPITQDAQLAQILDMRAERAMAYAKSRDAQGRSPSRIDTKGFLRARRGARR